MLVSVGLFVYGVLALFALSALLAANRFRLRRRTVLTRMCALLVLLAGAAALGWRDHLGVLAAPETWAACGVAVLVLGLSVLLERLPSR